jgi:SAM-dependent methyltransferase
MSHAQSGLVLGLDDGRSALISEYYDRMQRFYGRFWHETGVHYGLWETDVHTHDQAMRRMDERVGDWLALPPSSRVLDAGCGIGGTCFFLSQRHRHRVTGLTLSPDQLARALARRARFTGGPAPEFLLGSFVRTGFPDSSFDGVYGVESICYAEPRGSFLDEAFRILRPGGRLAVADGYVGVPRSARMNQDLQIFCAGFALASLCQLDHFVAEVERAGFRSVEVSDLTPLVIPSAVRICRLARLGALLVGLAGFLTSVPSQWYAHCHAGLVQLDLLHLGGMRYYCVRARKPGPP